MAKIRFESTNTEVEFEKGVETNILATAIRHNAGLPYKCGGGLCGTCRVHVEEGAENMTKVRKQEITRLGEEGIANGWRLGCMSFATDDVKLTFDASVKTKENEKLKQYWESK